MASLKGKVVIITGASSGFGASAAKLFAQEGCKVVLAARRLDRLEELAKELRAMGTEALPIAMDVSQPDQIDAMVRSVVDAYGCIDILFNNAGFGRLDWFEALDPIKDIQGQITVDLLGVLWTARAVLPQMYKQRSGHIINMCSIGGWAAPPLYTVYSAAKFGVRGFTEALRRETIPFGVHASACQCGNSPPIPSGITHSQSHPAAFVFSCPYAAPRPSAYAPGGATVPGAALHPKPRRAGKE